MATMHAIQGAVHWPSWGKLQMNPSECLAGVMLAMQKRLLKNSVGNGITLVLFAFHFGAPYK
jgi:hypothetical protein